MTTAPTVYTQFGYTLALAERTLTAVLQDHLAERGVPRPGTRCSCSPSAGRCWSARCWLPTSRARAP